MSHPNVDTSRICSAQSRKGFALDLLSLSCGLFGRLPAALTRKTITLHKTVEPGVTQSRAERKPLGYDGQRQQQYLILTARLQGEVAELFGDRPAFRDIVADLLGRVADAYAKDTLDPVEAETLRGRLQRLSQDIRAFASESLVSSGDEAAIEADNAACRDDEVEVVTGESDAPKETANPTAESSFEHVEQADVPTKRKRSTERGEGRAKLIAALTKHHKYADGGCLNLEPVGNNELARRAEVDQATASAFFKQRFEGHGKYKATCADAAQLVAALKLLNGEFAPHHLYGAKPPDEDDRDKE